VRGVFGNRKKAKVTSEDTLRSHKEKTDRRTHSKARAEREEGERGSWNSYLLKAGKSRRQRSDETCKKEGGRKVNRTG